ncbi:aminotransferase [Perkinsus olseni]|uniref:Ubiquitin thioesterase OTU n=1 Tax=Perkinsus olseni TaxID=32597 RepID=A0A7J6P006_PEROL|nr:aminotransferase [Perkinsus olseni]
MPVLTLQVRYGEKHVSVQVPDGANFRQLQEKLFEATGLPIDKQVVSVGFPQQRLLLAEPNAPLSALKIGKDDILSLSATGGSSESASSTSTVASRPVEARPVDLARTRFPILDPELVDLGGFHREPVPGDNSCMFTAVIRSLQLKGITTRDLRGIVARTIEANPNRYTEAVLDKPPKKYVRWICQDSSWGGYIELSILAPHFGVQINTVEIMTGHFYRYPQEVPQDTPCVYLLHDDTHYDYIASRSLVDGSRVSVFSSGDLRVASAAKRVADDLRRNRQYTDLGGFTLQCQECFALVIGQHGAIEHSSLTGHSRFQEISSGL